MIKFFSEKIRNADLTKRQQDIQFESKIYHFCLLYKIFVSIAIGILLEKRNYEKEDIKEQHSYPKWEYKIKNVSEVRYIFLESKLYDNSKNYFLKILGLAPCPLTPYLLKEASQKKMSESRPPLFFNFRGGLLSLIFSKNHSKCLKTVFFPLKFCLQYFVKKLQF